MRIDHKKGIIIILLIYVFLDFVRRFLGESKFALIAIDFSILLVYLLYISKPRVNLRIFKDAQAFLSVLFIFCLLIVFEIGNSYWPDLGTTLLGLRTYLLSIPFLFIGYRFATEGNMYEMDRFSKIMFKLATVTIIFGSISFIIRGGGSINESEGQIFIPMENKYHGYRYGRQLLTSSFFASSWRFANFLIFTYLISWARYKINGYNRVILIATYLVGFYIAGNRTHLTMFVGFTVLSELFALFKKQKAEKKRQSSDIFRKSTIVISIFLVYFILSYIRSEASSRVENIDSRSEYLIRERLDYWERIEDAFPLSRIDLNNPELLFGIGIGKYGQETAMSPNIQRKEEYFRNKFFRSSGKRLVADSGIIKIVVELGLIGLIIFFFIIIFIMGIVIKNIRRNVNQHYYNYAISFYPIVWVVNFFKGHPTISDLGATFLLYLSIGFLIYSSKR